MKKVMKKPAVCACMLLMFCAVAQAEIMEFEYYSLDVPEGWNVVEDGSTVTVIAGDKSASLAITADNPEGRTIAELAERYSRELNGTHPVADEDGSYTFDFNNGISQAVIDGDEDLYMLIIGTGIERNGEILEEILSSLEMR